MAASCAAALPVHDISGDFDGSRQGFDERVAKAAPWFYEGRFQRWREGGRDPEVELAQQLGQFPAISERYGRLVARLAGELQETWSALQGVFPEGLIGVPVTLLHSLGDGPGGLGLWQGQWRVIFGVDMMARQDLFEDHRPFMARVLFQAHHRAQFAGRGRLLDELWREGLALFVASMVVPTASVAELGFLDPPDLITLCKQRRIELLQDLLARGESTDTAVRDTYFGDVVTEVGTEAEVPSWIPRRAGYFMGWLMVQQASAWMDPVEMAGLDVGDAAALGVKALRAMVEESGTPLRNSTTLEFRL